MKTTEQHARVATATLALTTLLTVISLIPERARADSNMSGEVRFRIGGGAYRYSRVETEAQSLTGTTQDRSLHYTVGLEGRLYPNGHHGVIAGMEYRPDINSDQFLVCLISCSEAESRTNFGLFRAAYAYRVVRPTSRARRGRSNTRAWAFTFYAGALAGPTANLLRDESFERQSRSPVVGGTFGFNIDFHINRFFMGWSLRSDLLYHTQGPFNASYFIGWNAVPVFTVGIDIGRRTQDL